MNPGHRPRARQLRHDGWTPERKVRFLRCLAEWDDVRRACGIAGMSRQAAYRLRKRDALFAEAWTVALRVGRAARVNAIRARLSRDAPRTLSALAGASTSLPHVRRNDGEPGVVA